MTYDYYCLACDETVTITRPMAEGEPTSGCMCPRCGYRMIRQYTLAPIHFKGSGFYSKDNRLCSSTQSM